ncbi:hypothetical protein SCARD494_14115 [Seiridium cardinale]
MMFRNIIAALPFVAGVLSAPLESRAVSDFTIYAYGPNVHGLKVISINSTIYLTSRTPGDITNGHNATFNAPETRGNFTANIDGQGESVMYVPSESGPVGFTNDTSDSSLVTSGFGFYGHVIYVQIGSEMKTKWYAVPTSDETLYQLTWNEESNGTPVALRNIEPS